MPPGRKEAADKSLLVDMMLFALDNPAPATIVCVTGDMDFAPCLSKLKQRRYRIVLVHPGGEKRIVSENLIKAASEQYSWESVLSGNPTNAPPRVASSSPSPQRNDPKKGGRARRANSKRRGKGKGRARAGRSKGRGRRNAEINSSFMDPFAARVMAAINASEDDGIPFKEALSIHRRCYQEDGREWPSVVQMVAEMERNEWIVIEGEKPNQILLRGPSALDHEANSHSFSSRSASASSSGRGSRSDTESSGYGSASTYDSS